MERLNFFQQLCAGFGALAVCLLIIVFIYRFKYIWTVEFGQRAFWKRGVK